MQRSAVKATPTPTCSLSHTLYTDINECEGVTPCESETETCSNLIGSFKCKCKPGLVRVEGNCVEKIAKESNSKKRKKKKKTTKKDMDEQ